MHVINLVPRVLSYPPYGRREPWERGYTWVRRNLKETVLWSFITWTVLGKQNIKAKEVYFCFNVSGSLGESKMTFYQFYACTVQNSIYTYLSVFPIPDKAIYSLLFNTSIYNPCQIKQFLYSNIDKYLEIFKI